jgi:hypothetical protein
LVRNSCRCAVHGDAPRSPGAQLPCQPQTHVMVCSRWTYVSMTCFRGRSSTGTAERRGWAGDRPFTGSPGNPLGPAGTVHCNRSLTFVLPRNGPGVLPVWAQVVAEPAGQTGQFPNESAWPATRLFSELTPDYCLTDHPRPDRPERLGRERPCPRSHQPEARELVRPPEGETRQDASAEPGRPDAVPRIAVAEVDRPAVQRAEERQVIRADVDRPAPCILDPDVGE